jgi:hypothetical protein
MEIVVNQELTDNLNIKKSDLFINKKENIYACQLNEINDTLSRFLIPYDMCSTMKTV